MPNHVHLILVPETKDGLNLAVMVTGPWDVFLMSDVGQKEIDLFRKQEGTGRPMGDETLIDMLENLLDRTLKPQNLNLNPKRVSRVSP